MQKIRCEYKWVSTILILNFMAVLQVQPTYDLRLFASTRYSKTVLRPNHRTEVIIFYDS